MVCFIAFILFIDLFEDLVPISVQQALTAYEVRKTELVNAQVGKLRESTQLLNGYECIWLLLINLKNPYY